MVAVVELVVAEVEVAVVSFYLSLLLLQWLQV